MKSCPNCKSSNIILSGKVKERQRYKCKDCSKHFSVQIKSSSKSDQAYKIYESYKSSNSSIPVLAKEHGISHVTLYKWFDNEYWLASGKSDNVFKKVALNKEYVSPISLHFKGVQSTIRITPLENNVLIQYLKDGHKTTPFQTLNLFSLYDFREAYGEVYCTVRFNILNHVRNKRLMYSSKEELRRLRIMGKSHFKPIEILDFLNDEEEFDPQESNQRNVLRNITISDFLEFILSDNFNLILQLAKQKKSKM